MLKPAILILSGNAFSSILLFARNLVIARMISVEDYGIAATFAVTMAIVEMMSTIGLHQLIVQDRDGNEPTLQNGLQGVHFLRSLLSAAVLFFLSEPIAKFMGVPHVAWAYQALAIVPLSNGLMHFDIYRLQRRLNYVPMILSSLMPALVSVLAIWPMVVFFPDYRVMLFSVLLQAFLTMLTSHFLAERSYRLAWDKGIAIRAITFGWPLLLNNIMLFAVFQGEKVIVGRELGMAPLAIFAMGFTITLTPTLIMAKSAQSFFLPQLSAKQDESEDFQSLAFAALQASIINGLILIVATVLFAEPFVHALLGPKYADLIPLLPWLALLNAIRVFKAGNSVVSLARAHTSNPMIANVFRVFSIPISWYALVTGHGLLVVVLIGTAAEILGYAVSLGLVCRRTGLPIKTMLLPLALAGATLLMTVFHGYANDPTSNLPDAKNWSSVLVLLLSIVSFFTMRELRTYVFNAFMRRRRR